MQKAEPTAVREGGVIPPNLLENFRRSALDRQATENKLTQML